MSRKAAPAHLKLVTGRGNGRDSGGRPVQLGPDFERAAPTPPDWLPDEARAEWARVVPELERLGLLKPLDRAALTAYCLSWQRLYAAQRDIAAGNVTTKGSQGQLVKHPSVMVAEAASKEIRAWAGEFGLTPSAEGRLSGGKGSDAGDTNPFAGTAEA